MPSIGQSVVSLNVSLEWLLHKNLHENELHGPQVWQKSHRPNSRNTIASTSSIVVLSLFHIQMMSKTVAVSFSSVKEKDQNLVDMSRVDLRYF